jgi:hypothetical protein
MSNKSVALLLASCAVLSALLFGCMPDSDTSVEDHQTSPVILASATIEPTIQQPLDLATVAPTATAPISEAPVLAFLRDGDVWVYSFAGGREEKITHTGNITAFTWSPDGNQIAVYNNQWQLCFQSIDGASPVYPCQNIEPAQNLFAADHAPIRLAWSAAQPEILVQQAEWWLVDLATSQVRHIPDPRQWGANWSSGNEGNVFLGQALLLPNGSLLGAATHVNECGSGGCFYRLFVLDAFSQRMEPFSYVEGGTSLTMTSNGRYLLTSETPHVGCASYTTYINIVDLSTGEQSSFTFPQATFFDQAFTPGGDMVVLAPGEGCSSSGPGLWSVSCGLMTDFFDLYPMQLWDWQDNSIREIVPGLQPAWSPDGQKMVFRSCLGLTPAGNWSAVSQGPPWLYVLEMADNDFVISPLAIGEAPAWQP